jgi:hypothetical protein
VTIVCAFGTVLAEDAPSPVKHLKPPKGVKLTPEQQKELDFANECLEKGYRLLVDEHKPEQAVQELRKAYAVTQMMNTLKGTESVMAGVAPGNERGTPFDKVETQGGIEKIVEIGAANGIGAPPEVDNGLHKRKIIKATDDERKKIEAEQKTVTIELQQMAAAGAGGGEDKPKDNDEQKKLETPGAPPQAQNAANQQQAKSGKPQNANAKQQQAGGGAAQTAQNEQPDAKQQAQDNAANAGKSAQTDQQKGAQQNQNNSDPANPKQQQQNGGAAAHTAQNNPDSKQQPQQNGGGAAQSAQNQNNPDTKQQQNGGAQQQTAQNQQNQNDAQNNGGAQQTTNANAQAVANKEDAVARALNEIANQYAQMKGNEGNRTANKFRQAAAAAARTADMIRNKDFNAAAASSADAERRIGDAMKDAGMASARTMSETIDAVKKQLEKMQAEQQKLLAQSQTAGQDAGGAPAPDSVRKDRQTALMLEESKLKPQIEQLQNAINELAGGGEANSGGDTHTADNAAREELGKARADLQRGKTRQAVVDATMKLGEGDLQGAATAMAKVQDAFNRVQQRLAAADNALGGNEGDRDERNLNNLRELGAKLARLKNTAQAAAGNPSGQQEGQANSGQQNAGGKQNPGEAKSNAKNDAQAQGKGAAKGEQQTAAGENGKEKSEKADNESKGKQNGEKGGDAAKSQTAGAENSANKNDAGEAGAHGEVTASWGQVLNNSARQINNELLSAAGHMGKVPGAKLIEELARKDPAFERDFDHSLAQVNALLSAVEKLEAGLAEKVETEKEKKAMKDYRKDDVPGAYKPAVAAYYEELSKTGEKR